MDAILLFVMADLGSEFSADACFEKHKKVCEGFEPELSMPVKTVEAGNHRQCVPKCSEEDACVTVKYENGNSSFYLQTDVKNTTRVSESVTYMLR